MSTPDAIDIAIRNLEDALMRKRLADSLLEPCRTLMRAAGPVATTCRVCRPGDPVLVLPAFREVRGAHAGRHPARHRGVGR